jgi:hypothetical protein
LPRTTIIHNKYGDYNYYSYSSNNYCLTWNTTSYNHYYLNYHTISENCQQSTNRHVKGTRRRPKPRRIWRI